LYTVEYFGVGATKCNGDLFYAVTNNMRAVFCST